MTNHVHLVVTPGSERSLAQALGRTHLMYAQYAHRLHGRTGHFWQSRFYSCPLDEAHAHNAAAYLELNPVRDGLVKRAWAYPWSSAQAHCSGIDPSGLLDLEAWLKQMPAAEWKATLKAIAGDRGAIDALRTHTRTGRPLGGDAFLNHAEALAGRPIRPRPPGRPKGSQDQHPRKRGKPTAAKPRRKL